MQPEQNQNNWQQPAPVPTNEYHPATPVLPEQPPVASPVPPIAPQQPVTSTPAPIPVQPVVPVAPMPAPVTDQPVEIAAPVAPVSTPEQSFAQPQSPVETPLPDEQAVDLQSDDDAELIRWEATEVIDHDRPPLWYAILGIVVLVLMALAIFLLHSITFAILIPIMAAALVVYARKPPAHIQYILSRKGLHINDKLAAYDNFRAFSVITHAGHNTVTLIPRKRFALSESVYFPDEIGETIVDMLAARLPMKDSEPDMFDRIINRLRL